MATRTSHLFYRIFWRIFGTDLADFYWVFHYYIYETVILSVFFSLSKAIISHCISPEIVLRSNEFRRAMACLLGFWPKTERYRCCDFQKRNTPRDWINRSKTKDSKEYNEISEKTGGAIRITYRTKKTCVKATKRSTSNKKPQPTGVRCQ